MINTTISWMMTVAGLIFLTLHIYSSLRGKEKVATPEDDEPKPLLDQDIERLEKYEKVYRHFEYEQHHGLTFADYVRKAEAGNMGDFDPVLSIKLEHYTQAEIQ